jgi:hypothetical protein
MFGSPIPRTLWLPDETRQIKIHGDRAGLVAGQKRGSMMPTEVSTEIRMWPARKSRKRDGAPSLVMDHPWKRLQNEFRGLMEEEDRIVQQRVPQDCLYAYFTHRESGEFHCWPASITTDSLRVRFELLATEAGIALGSRTGTAPFTYCVHRLSVDLRANNSNLIRIFSDSGGLIDRLLEASANYCARLHRESLEKTAMSYQDGKGVAGQHRFRETAGDLDSAPEGSDIRNYSEFTSKDERRAAVGRYANHWACCEAALARAARVDPADLSKWKRGELPAESDKRARIEKALIKNEKPILTKRLRPDW